MLSNERQKLAFQKPITLPTENQSLEYVKNSLSQKQAFRLSTQCHVMVNLQGAHKEKLRAPEVNEKKLKKRSVSPPKCSV